MLGADGDEFVEARREERDALERLASAAREVLTGGGHSASDATVDKVVRTLRAAAVSEQGRALLSSGTLTEEVEPQGFEAFMGLELQAKPRKAESKPPQRDRSRRETATKPRRMDQRLTRARAKLLEARSEARGRGRELTEAEKRLAAAVQEMERTEADVARARANEARSRERLERAEEEVRRLSE